MSFNECIQQHYGLCKNGRFHEIVFQPCCSVQMMLLHAYHNFREYAFFSLLTGLHAECIIMLFYLDILLNCKQLTHSVNFLAESWFSQFHHPMQKAVKQKWRDKCCLDDFRKKLQKSCGVGAILCVLRGALNTNWRQLTRGSVNDCLSVSSREEMALVAGSISIFFLFFFLSSGSAISVDTMLLL